MEFYLLSPMPRTTKALVRSHTYHVGFVADIGYLRLQHFNSKTTHHVASSLSVVNNIKGLFYSTVNVMIRRLKRGWRYSSTHS
jgi:hypothetical protein